MNRRNGYTPELVLPDGWEVAAEGMRSIDGKHRVTGFQLGCDPAGELLVVQEGGTRTDDRILPDLGSQIAVALRHLNVPEVPVETLERLLTDLGDAIRWQADTHEAEFFHKVHGGDLFNLLDNFPGIGPRRPVNVADTMRRGVRERKMLLDEWLVAGELHWIQAEPGLGKTWVALVLALRVMLAGGRVVWVDEEIGVDSISERLLALGADPDLVETNFLYFPYPGWGAAQAEDAERWQTLIAADRPDLVVFDTCTDVLAEADIDENSGLEVTRWIKAYCEPPRRVGAAVLILDHIVKGGSNKSRGYAIGSRAKKAKCKIQYQIEPIKPFDQDVVGKVKVVREKLGVSARIPEERYFEIGPGQDGIFVFEPGSAEAPAKAKRAAKSAEAGRRRRDRILKLLRDEHPERRKKTWIRERVSGDPGDISNDLAEMVDGDKWPVDIDNESNYGFTPPDSAPE
ncbi:MAG: AAA family ATPase [Solirubrobacterales bacterium]